MRRTHVAGGVAAWLGLAAVVPLPPVAVLVGVPVAASASLWPDLDHPGATASRWLGPVTWALSVRVERAFGGHRAGTHSLVAGAPLFGLLGGLAALAVGLGAVTLLDLDPWLAVRAAGVCAAASWAGAVSHVLLDMVTCNCGGCDRRRARRRPWDGRHRAGVEVLWPLVRRRFGVPLLPVGGELERLLARPLVAALGALAGAAVLAGW
jgi:membrane-bound metal-dependent hydrolase YbcI (DUF457 family)